MSQSADSAGAIAIAINGEPRRVPAGGTVLDLLANLGIEAGRVAVELNREIVRRQAWAETPVEDGDAVEIVHFVGGG
ncbi:MAG: sulfur carrier protein ThiS [Bryobacteraceae bacterium]